jgi:1-acyl-sn-glycerol-3-phosphate acyltransferase
VNNAPRFFFFLFARFIVFVLLGLNVRRKELLPQQGPAIIVANHNSHLDTLVLMSLFPLKTLPHLRPVAAADYFLRNRFMKWFSTRIIGIVPMDRGKVSKNLDPLQPCCDALAKDDILILFPEGTRGKPEQISQFKRGIAHLAERFPATPVTPIFIHGLGKALPKGDFVLVPFFCDMFVGESFTFASNKDTFMVTLNDRFQGLVSEGHFNDWA